jgi:hypothetical protein
MFGNFGNFGNLEIPNFPKTSKKYYQMFGRYLEMEEYFSHRQNNESRLQLFASGPRRRPLAIDYQPPCLSSRPSGRQLSYDDLRHQFYGRPREFNHL